VSVEPTVEDARFMTLALALGRRGLGRTWPNPAVGAVIVQPRPGGAVVVGRGWTQAGGRPHAETEALRRAGTAARGATLYATLEPCSHYGKTPPCADAIVAAGIARVVSAAEDPNPEIAGRGHGRLRDAGIAVAVGIGAADAARDHAGHIRRMRDKRPHVILKLAVSADDKVALAGRRPMAITGTLANERVHGLRATSDAILIGIGTALADDPLLTCRLPGMAEQSPVRVVLDADLRLPLTSRLVQSAADTPLWVVAGREAAAEQELALRRVGVDVLRVDRMGDRLNLRGGLEVLAARGVTRLMVEGGPTVAASFANSDLVDELILFRSPNPIGADGIDALEGVALAQLTQAKHLQSRGVEPIGVDTMQHFWRA
jgi:diaminohydroxyphosphoribosylaminopyrimidine deaminase/5-amino-6-(5-phosphoribosylamino)uracil reductase